MENIGTKNRINSIDHLKAILVLGMMFYHYVRWTLNKYHSDSFYERIDVYWVSIFHVLCGMMMYSVWSHKKIDVNFLKEYSINRFFRIFPILWIALLFAFGISQKTIALKTLVLNFSGLFSFFDWSNYMSSGLWSIGNQIFFYAFFPLLLFTHSKYKWVFYILLLSSIVLFIYYPFFVLDSSHPISEQWKLYVNPFNQLFLFIGGYLMALYLKSQNWTMIKSAVILVAGLAILFCYPARGNTIDIVSGLNRIIFSVSCFLICAGISKMNYSLPSPVNNFLGAMGKMSLSIYLLHPLVFSMLMSNQNYLMRLQELPRFFAFAFPFCMTLFVSVLTYFAVEKTFIQLGKRIAAKAIKK